MLTTGFPRFQGDLFGSFILELAKALVRQGEEVLVIAPHEAGLPGSEHLEGVEIRRFRYFYPARWQCVTYGGGIPTNVSRSWMVRLQLPFFLLGFFWAARRAAGQSHLAGTYSNLGRLLARRGNAERAAEYLEKAQRLDPYNVEVLVNRGLVYQRSGREDDAERMYRAALAIRPDYAEGYNNLGLLYAGRGETQRALGALERAVQLKPDYVAAQINLQVQQSRAAGEPPHAAYLKLLRQYPQRAELWQGLTSAYAAAGRIDAAIEACRKILELDPGNVRARENLQKLLAARGTSE